jgi:hypothetical protein
VHHNHDSRRYPDTIQRQQFAVGDTTAAIPNSLTWTPLDLAIRLGMRNVCVHPLGAACFGGIPGGTMAIVLQIIFEEQYFIGK